MNRNVEILAPAGSYQSLQASFKAGADAVYMGGRKFGARAYCDNPEDEDLIRAINYAHLRGKRLYLTVNTVVKANELDEFVEFIKPLYEAGLDAVIVQDLGLVSVVQNHFPKLPIHLSTQMSITEGSAIRLLGANVTRVVPARELTIKEIEQLKKDTGIELEVFVHGALCYSYSGQCLFSSMCGERSGNRGRCAQPCRKQYEANGKKSYILSPKDICTLDNLPELIEAGVDSFKIEGRMKSPEYASLVANIYRRACDLYFELGREGYYQYIKNHIDEWEEYKRNLLDIFNRGGFSKGYAFGETGPSMMSTKRPNHEGVFVGKALIKGGKASLKPEIDLYKGDVLEIRNNNSAEWYSYTLPENISAFNKNRQFINFKAYSRVYNSRIDGQEVDVYRYRAQGLLDEVDEKFVNAKDYVKVKGELTVHPGEPLKLCVSLAKPHPLTGEIYECFVLGNVVDEASTRPVSEEFVKDKILRSGDSEYEFVDLKISMSDNAFVPKSVLGNIRREALAKLSSEILGSFSRQLSLHAESYAEPANDTCLGAHKNQPAKKELHVIPTTESQLDVLLDKSEVDAVVIDAQFPIFDKLAADVAFADKIINSGKKLYLRTLHIYDSSNASLQDKLIEIVNALGTKLSGVYVRNLSIMSKLLKADALIIADYNLYSANDAAVSKLADMGAAGFTYSPELSERECLAIENEAGLITVLDVYSKTELMLSKQCIKKTMGLCNHTEEWRELKDQMGNSYSYYSLCRECKNVIVDCEPTILFGQTENVLANVERIILSNEDGNQIAKIIEAYNNPEQMSKLGIKEKIGHFHASVL